MRSQDQLRDSLSGVRKLAELEASYPDPPADGDRLAAYSLRGACVVLTVASFESFLRTFFEESLDHLNRQRVPLIHYPAKFRVNAIYSSLELAMKGDHTNRGLEKVDRLSEVSRAAHLISIDSFLPRALADTQSNPDSACIKRLLKNVDLTPNGFTVINAKFAELWPDPVPLNFAETFLDALVQSRHRVAHTADAAHIARQDLIRNCDFVEVFAQTLTQVVSDHIQSIILSAREDFSASLRS